MERVSVQQGYPEESANEKPESRFVLIGVLFGMLLGLCSLWYTVQADVVLLAVAFCGLIGGSWGMGHAASLDDGVEVSERL